LMSYTDGPQGYYYTYFTTGPGGSLQGHYQYVGDATPMVLDIAAIQARYGADPTTATGNDVYAFTDNQIYYQAIYDAGGTDTFDLSAVTRGSTVDLRPGAYSSIAYWSVADQIAYNDAHFNPSHYSGFTTYISGTFDAESYTWTNNVGIAYST